MQLLTKEQFSSNYKTDVSAYTETIQGKYKANYISWANAVYLNKTNHPELSVAFEKDANGSPVFTEGKFKFLQPYITDGEKRTPSLFYPIMDSRHNAIEYPNACEINKGFQRATAKAISVFTGLGLGLFAGEDLPEPIFKDEDSKQNNKPNNENPVAYSGSFSGAWTDYRITFGKHNGKTLGELAEKAPSYIDFLQSDKFEIRSPALQEAVDKAMIDIKQGYSSAVDDPVEKEEALDQVDPFRHEKEAEQTADADAEEDEDVPF